MISAITPSYIPIHKPFGDVKPVAASTPDDAESTHKIESVSEEEREQLESLKSRDREVRAHEAAHLAAASAYASGGAQFTFERGPDGTQYAVGGEVNIDISAIAGDPEATLEKAETIRRAALAPAQPSGQDRQVAASATQIANQARAEIARAESPTDNPARKFTDIENILHAPEESTVNLFA